MKKCFITSGPVLTKFDLYQIQERNRAKIRNQFNQTPHLTQNTKGKVTTSELDITNESQEVNPFPAGDHKASINRRARNHNKKKQDRNNINDPQTNHRLGTVTKNISLEGLNLGFLAYSMYHEREKFKSYHILFKF